MATKVEKIEVVSLCDLIGETIRRVHTNESLQKMFEIMFK
jgi:phosphoribosylpyrophosphate synthetase